MELDLSMYKEGYRNIAMQINELNNNSEAEIERLEGVIAENQAQIRNWDEPYEYYNYPEAMQKNEYNKDFENYARPFNEEIRKAQNRIAELQSSMEENQEQMKQNKEKQKQLLVHMQTARKNAEEAYKEARKQLEEEWENSSEQKEYYSKLETIALLQDRKDRTPEESQNLINLSREVRSLKMAQNTKMEELEKQYKEFLQEIDDIDVEFGIDKLQKEFELEPEAEPVQEQKPEPVQEPISEPEPAQTPKPEPKPPQIPKPEPKPAQAPKPEPKPAQTPKPEPKPAQTPKPEPKPAQTPKSEPKPAQTPKPEPKPAQTPKSEPKPAQTSKPQQKPAQTPRTQQSQKFSYTFSKKGINYDGKHYSPKKLLDFYENPENQEGMNKIIADTLKGHENIKEFINNADRLIYLSIMNNELDPLDDGKTVILRAKAKERLLEYYKIWSNPESQEKSNMNITYDFKGFSRLARYFTGNRIPLEELKVVKQNAFEQRKRNNVQIKNEGLFTKLKYKLKDWLKATTEKIKLLEDQYENEEYDDEYEYEEEDSKSIIDSAKAFRQGLQDGVKKVQNRAEKVKKQITYKPKHLTPKTKSTQQSSKDEEGR